MKWGAKNAPGKSPPTRGAPLKVPTHVTAALGDHITMLCGDKYPVGMMTVVVSKFLLLIEGTELEESFKTKDGDWFN